ncbi:MAG: ankyrin repeat domain-containing protein [Janthinobacterium lividum]
MSISYRAAQTLIKRGDEAALRTAIESGLDPSLANHNGWSLLMLAALEGAVPIGHLLLDAGATLEAANRHGETALSLAAQKGHVDFLELLIAKGASTDLTPHGTPLSVWLTNSPGLSEAKLTEVLNLLSGS